MAETWRLLCHRCLKHWELDPDVDSLSETRCPACRPVEQPKKRGNQV